MPSRVGVEEIDCGVSCLGSINGGFEDADGEPTTCSRSYSYHKLPPHLLKLSILKLDGSAFDVLIEKNATVGQLKQAIEDVFISSTSEGPSQISWSHVWGHFCLSFEGWKLLNDRTYVREFGITDGDQLRFVRHLSINYSPMRRRSKSQNHLYRQPPLSTVFRDTEESSADEEEEKHLKAYNLEDHEVPLPEFSLSHFLRGCISYSRLWGENRKGSGAKGRPSRFAMQCLPRGTNGYTAMEV
ncbi:uncharacterized protein LOC116201274 [Punica granatum]|uniref:SNRNP25 ubiquitin-like domain-containing protein n=2 Tax=Punica granatum TaxID=22663 RepID=A0A218WAU1_PUNGR|nr:uncharacterized protein LOC116201274 [Punica granatum]OWM69619.1 hypothetical protein CDL15_Pgr014080 [Punica granatum]PKI31998.1 hypothetical protein CRG98_047607 [Punica granatum]